MNVLFYDKKRIKVNVTSSIVCKEAEKKDVNFYDYDGVRLFSYTNAEALALTSLPENTSEHENLTFDEWNWTLSEIKNQINNVGGDVNVGAIYHTTDGKTHITYKPTVVYPQAYIFLTPSLANDVTVDWGDGSTDTWTSASEESKSHTYTGVTDSSVYDITISCTTGTYSFTNYITNEPPHYYHNYDCAYTDVKLSNKVTGLGRSCFSFNYYLQTISISNSVSELEYECFNNCHSLQSVNIPRNIIIGNSGGSCFRFCSSLRNITIPGNVTSLCGYFVNNCRSLQSITIPNGVTSLGDYVFTRTSLLFVAIPNTVTGLGDNCFGSCYSLQSMTIPSGVTSLGSGFISSCSSLTKLYVKPTTPPALRGYTSIPYNNKLVIYVPVGSLSAYQSASNWSMYASNMIEYNFN